MRRQEAATFRFKSPAQAWVDDSTLDFKKFVETRGPRGGRMVIDTISLHAELSLTVATATTQGEDLYRVFRKVTVEEVNGCRRLNEVTGDALRVISFAHMGADETHEHPDFAAGGPTTVNFTCAIPLTKKYAHEPGDYSMAAEMLERISVTCAKGSNLSLGASVVTVNSGTYWVICECHEEFDLVQHLQDEWIVRPFAAASTTEQELNFSKGRIQDLYLHIPGSDGGQTLANLTDVYLEHLMPRALRKDPDLKQHYARSRGQCQSGLSAQGAARTTDPFIGATLRACAVVLTTGTKAFEGPERTQVQIKLTNSADLPAAANIISRIVYPRDAKVTEGLGRRYGKKPAYLKTASKSSQNPGAWDAQYRDYLPVKFR